MLYYDIQIGYYILFILCGLFHGTVSPDFPDRGLMVSGFVVDDGIAEIKKHASMIRENSGIKGKITTLFDIREDVGSPQDIINARFAIDECWSGDWRTIMQCEQIHKTSVSNDVNEARLFHSNLFVCIHS